FAPRYRTIENVIAACAGARSSLYFAAFSFYHAGLGAAMIERARAGVAGRGIFSNASTAAAASQYPPMIAAGLAVRVPQGIFLHHKFILVDYGTDDPIVITGSLNFSSSAANENDEALYVIHDRYVADAFYAVWRSLYDPAVGANRDDDGLPDVVISEVLAGGFIEL